MLTGIGQMFDNMKSMLKHLKKRNYESNMAQFLKDYNHYFDEMTEYVDASENKENAAKEIAVQFANEVENKFAAGMRKKIPGAVQIDINFFMIYYVFPAILKTNHEHCRLIADSIRDEWKVHFKDSDIGYTDYDTLYGTFREKIFGIF